MQNGFPYCFDAVIRYGEIYDAHLLLPENEAFTPGDIPPVQPLPLIYQPFVRVVLTCLQVPPPEPLLYDRNTQQATIAM